VRRVQGVLELREPLTLGEGGEVEKAEIHGLLELEGLPFAQEDGGDMRLHRGAADQPRKERRRLVLAGGDRHQG
jgi:hypothetical protein